MQSEHPYTSHKLMMSCKGSGSEAWLSQMGNAKSSVMITKLQWLISDPWNAPDDRQEHSENLGWTTGGDFLKEPEMTSHTWTWSIKHITQFLSSQSLYWQLRALWFFSILVNSHMTFWICKPQKVLLPYYFIIYIFIYIYT